jgi:hypothetical protein
MGKGRRLFSVWRISYGAAMHVLLIYPAFLTRYLCPMVGFTHEETRLLPEFAQSTSEKVIQYPPNGSGKSRSGAFESVLETGEQIPQGE